MPKIIFIEHNGAKHVLEAKVGYTVMEVALENNLPGIMAECGGSLACATCHVYVSEPWLGLMPKKSLLETEMLDFADQPQANSRLSCQLRITDEMDGFIIKIPESQG